MCVSNKLLGKNVQSANFRRYIDIARKVEMEHYKEKEMQRPFIKSCIQEKVKIQSEKSDLIKQVTTAFIKKDLR